MLGSNPKALNSLFAASQDKTRPERFRKDGRVRIAGRRRPLVEIVPGLKKPLHALSVQIFKR